MKKITNKLATLLIVPAVLIGLGLSAVPVGAQASDAIKKGIDASGGSSNNASIDVGATVLAVVNWMLFAVGIIAVIMLIWGGIKYATSAGDSSKVTSAKNTILYAIVGLVVAVLAFAIVNFVVDNLTGGTLQGPA